MTGFDWESGGAGLPDLAYLENKYRDQPVSRSSESEMHPVFQFFVSKN
jgi:hypothetical protein